MHFINYLRALNQILIFHTYYSKFHKTPVKFRTVTVGYNIYSNDGNNFFLNDLKQIYDLTLNTNNTHCLKNNYQLIESLNMLKNVNNIVAYNSADLFSNINLNDSIIL